MQTEKGVTLPEKYLFEAMALIQANFIYPTHEKRKTPVTCVVQFPIRRDGKIFDVKVKTPSNRGNLDRYAVYGDYVNPASAKPGTRS